MLCFASPFSRFFPIQFYPFLYFHILQLPKLNYRPLFTLPAATSSRSSPRDQRKTFSYMLFLCGPPSHSSTSYKRMKKKIIHEFLCKKESFNFAFCNGKTKPHRQAPSSWTLCIEKINGIYTIFFCVSISVRHSKTTCKKKVYLE